MDEYIRLHWPEFLVYQEYEGYCENAVYDSFENTSFIRKNWLIEMNKKYGN